MILEKRIKQCTSLTPIENEIANYILTHQEAVLHLSIQDLAAKVFVSKSAIHRLCKKLDLKGFNELKVQLSQDQMEVYNDSNIDVNYPFKKEDDVKRIAKRLMDLYETTVQDTYHYIDEGHLMEVAKLMHCATCIDIYTHAHNINAAENFRDKMLTIGKEVTCPTSFYEQRMMALKAKESHVALILSYSGKATYIDPIVKLLHEKQVTIVMIGKVDSNLYPDKVKYHLCISDKENLRNRISQFSSHIALQYMLDVIFGCIYNIDRDNNIEYLKKSIHIMDDREV